MPAASWAVTVMVPATPAVAGDGKPDTTRLLAALTFRPEFSPLWGARSYLTPLTLRRLDRPQVETMVENVTGGKALPAEVVQQQREMVTELRGQIGLMQENLRELREE